MRKLLSICCWVFALHTLGFAQALDSSLIRHQIAYDDFTKPEAYYGGDTSRFVWQEMLGFFPHQSVNHNETRILGNAVAPDLADWKTSIDGVETKFDDYVISDDRIDSIVILKSGNIVYQRFKSHSPLQRHATWSVTKAIVGAALGKLAAQNKVQMQQTVKTYLPSFAETAWANIKLQDIYDMSSGIACLDSDGWDTKNTCIYKLDKAANLLPSPNPRAASMTKVLKNMKAHRPPGAVSEYVSANTIILGMVIESVMQQSLAEALSTLIWQKMGAEADGMMLISPRGEAYAAMSARLYDIARFGLYYLENAEVLQAYSNKPPPPFSETMQQNLKRLFQDDAPLHSRSQWDLVWSDGDMYKDGFSGQGLYISPKNDLVFAWFGTADLQFQKHQLLPLARQMTNSMDEADK